MSAYIASWDAMHYSRYPRLIQTIRWFKTILGKPNFPSYTSGHSTTAAADVLGHIFPAESPIAQAWADEAVILRIVQLSFLLLHVK